jgi:hypothetical protein
MIPAGPERRQFAAKGVGHGLRRGPFDHEHLRRTPVCDGLERETFWL